MPRHAPKKIKSSIFEFRDYKAFLRSWIASNEGEIRGVRSRIAESAHCHLAYISQVLSGNSHFNLEQAEALRDLLGLRDEEVHFFLLLVERARAGTGSLARYFDQQIEKILNMRLELKNRFVDKKTLNEQDQALYYSHWAYCAVHMAVLNPDRRNIPAIAKYLDLDLRLTGDILEFLTSVGLVKRESGAFTPGEGRIHLGHDSPMISKHHTNWRMQAIRSFERSTPHELHYSGVISLSREELPKLRETLVQALEKARALVKDSKDEVVYCYSIDLFGLGREKSS